MNNKLAVIDQNTGVVTQEEEEGVSSIQLINLLESKELGNRGLFLQDECLALSIDPKIQADVCDLYDVEAISFGEITNQKLMVYGAAIYEVPAGMGKGDVWHERYFQSRVLVMIDDQLRIVKSSGQGLLFHVARACFNRGWFIWNEPIEYKFVWKGAGTPHYMERVDRNIKRVLPRL
jgi:hypothetical protein